MSLADKNKLDPPITTVNSDYSLCMARCSGSVLYTDIRNSVLYTDIRNSVLYTDTRNSVMSLYKRTKYRMCHVT